MTDTFFVIELLNGLTGKFEPSFNTASGFVYRYASEGAALRALVRCYPWHYCARAFRVVFVP